MVENDNKKNIYNMRIVVDCIYASPKMSSPTVQTPDNPIMDSSEEEAEDSDEDWCAGEEGSSGSAEVSSDDTGSEGEVEKSEGDAGEGDEDSLTDEEGASDSAEESEDDTSQDEEGCDETQRECTQSQEQHETGITTENGGKNTQKMKANSENPQPRKRRKCVSKGGK